VYRNQHRVWEKTMTENVFDKVKCSKCQLIKNRLKTSTQYRNKTWFYLDENKQRWEGLICPMCLKEKHARRNEKNREAKKHRVESNI